MSPKMLKVGSLIVSLGGFAIGLASDYIGKKNVANDVVNSKEFQDLLAKQVEKVLNSGK